MIRKSLLFLCCLFCAGQALGQDEWKLKPKSPLYEDNLVTVYIEYRISPDVCAAGGVQSQFRYRLEKKKQPIKKRYYINWRFDYFNCNNELVSQNNCLEIPAQSNSGIIQNPECIFPGIRVANIYYDIKPSDERLNRAQKKPVYSSPLEPHAITGNLEVIAGNRTTLSVSGGYLPEGAYWQWYQDACEGLAVDKGPTISVIPTKDIRYFVRAEGKGTSPCISVLVHIADQNIAATSINGNATICGNEGRGHLSVVGGKLAAGGKWVWYSDSCNGEKAGEGPDLDIPVQTTTTYFVRAEGPSNVTDCKSFRITVLDPSINPKGIVAPESVDAGAQFRLSVDGGSLGSGAKWVWYANGTEPGDRLTNTGSYIGIDGISNPSTYYVRAEGSCGNTDFVSAHVNINPPRIVEQPRRRVEPSYTYHPTRTDGHPDNPYVVFINGGVVAQSANDIKSNVNYAVTIGGGKDIGWYVRGKFSSNTDNTVEENSVDFSQYSYNGQAFIKRMAYTGGIFLGGKVLSIYLGGGYSKSELLFGLNQNSPGDAAHLLVPISGENYTGFEGEAGLMLRIGFLNIMGGANSIRFQYTDYFVGLGFNL